MGKKIEPSGVIALIVGDKSMLSNYFRRMYFGFTLLTGHVHEDRQVVVYPEDISMDEDDIFITDEEGRKKKNRFYSVSIVPMNKKGVFQKLPIPLCMLNCSQFLKERIIACGLKKGWKITEKHFSKCSVLMPLNDLIDLERAYINAEDEDCHLSFDQKDSLDR